MIYKQLCVFFFFLKKNVRYRGIIFKKEIENYKKLKPNETFEFIDWDKNEDEKKI